MNTIKLTKYISIGFIALSLISIMGYIAQQIKDQTKTDLEAHVVNKDQIIDGLTIELLQAHNNNANYAETELGAFLEGLDLISKQKSIINLRKEIDALQSRTDSERTFIESVSILLISIASLIFFTLILLINKRNKDKNIWLHSLAHQLRNSISPISLGFENLKLELSKDDRDKVLNALSDDIRKLESLTSKMLKLFTLKQTGSISKKPVNLGSSIKGVIDHLELQNKKELTLSFSTNVDKSLISGDEDLIRQVFINLINNAMGFSHPKGEVSIEISKERLFTIVKVIDQGIGNIDKDKILIDGAVYPSKKVGGSNTGHGIGLKLVRRIMKLHGGKFDINNNKDGKGVTTTVTFPH